MATKYFKTVDILGWIANIIGIISFIPQCWQIHKTNDTKAISLVMYILIVISFILWVIYGYIIKASPVMGGNIVMFFLGSYILVRKSMNYKKDSQSEKFVNYTY